MPHKILIADDEPALLSFMVTILQRVGYQTVAADDGQKAVTLVGEEKPELLLLDLWLPKLNGVEVMKKMRQSPEQSKIPVILITADINFKSTFSDFEFKDFFLKPFNTGDLLKKIESYLVKD